MSELLVRPGDPDLHGCVLDITPASAGWSHVGFKVCRLAAGQSIRRFDTDRETCVVLLAGAASVRAATEEFQSIGGRASVFDDAAPGVVYVPAGMVYIVTATTAVEVALRLLGKLEGEEAVIKTRGWLGLA